jgi:histidyl-tRNA synthetase
MPTLRPVRRLPNMNDRSAAAIERAEDTARRCIEVLARRGYTRLDTPILEETELFLRKSGGELSSRLYDFTEPGGFRTSLRPEFTAPVIRHAIETGDISNGVCRFQYFGPVFRYARPETQYGKRPRQFNQLGAEATGVAAPEGDGEVIAVALEGLAALGLSDVKVALGHVGLLRQVLGKYDLSRHATQFLVTSVDSLRAGKGEEVRAAAAKLGFTGERAKISSSRHQETIEAVIAQSIGPLGDNAGARTREEIIKGLVRKQQQGDDPAQFESALSMLTDLVAVSGPVEAAIADGRRLARKNRLDESCFTLLSDVAEAAVTQGVAEERLEVAVGLARGVAYYTGMVFDIVQHGVDDSLGGGGRYDGLTRALGSDVDVPALGFAYNFDAVLEATGPAPRGAAMNDGPVLVRPESPAARRAAAQKAAELRRQGRAAVLDTGSEAATGRFSAVITVAADGTLGTEQAR